MWWDGSRDYPSSPGEKKQCNFDSISLPKMRERNLIKSIKINSINQIVSDCKIIPSNAPSERNRRGSQEARKTKRGKLKHPLSSHNNLSPLLIFFSLPPNNLLLLFSPSSPSVSSSRLHFFYPVNLSSDLSSFSLPPSPSSLVSSRLE